MEVDENGLLRDAMFYRSPNFSDRSSDEEITAIVIHCISLPEGKYGNSLPHDLFLNQISFEEHPELEELRVLKVSSHILIDRTGRINQYVPFTKKAWHAGLSKHSNRMQCNEFSVGIELEGAVGDEFSPQQYEVLPSVLAALFNAYQALSFGSIVGHNEISPTRKEDPGKRFSWTSVYSNLIAQLRR